MAKDTPTSMADILDRPVDSFERPKPLPVGTYLWTIVGQPRQDVSDKKQTPYVEFTCKAMAAMDDVDPEALAECGGLAERQKKITFYLTEGATYRLREFLEHCGVEVDGKKGSQAIAEAAGCQFLGIIKHTTADDGEAIYDNIRKTMKAE